MDFPFFFFSTENQTQVEEFVSIYVPLAGRQHLNFGRV